MAGRNMNYELDLFERFEKVLVDGKPISGHTLFKDTPLWHRFYQFVFDSDIKQFAKTKSYELYKKEIVTLSQKKFSAIVASIFFIFINMLGILWMFIVRPKVLVFSVDKVSDKNTKSDFRLSGIYAVLKKNKISFFECFHTLVGRDFFVHLFKRRRLGLYLESLDVIWYAIRLFRIKPSYEVTNILGTSEEAAFIRYTVNKYFALKGMLEFRKAVLCFIVKYSGVKIVLGIDDVRHYHELLEAAKDSSIPSVLVQHGHFTKYHVGWLARNTYADMRYIKADKLLVWNSYWKEELLRLNSVYKKEDIEISGYPDKKASVLFKEKDGKINILIPHETDAPKEEVLAFIRELAGCENVQVYFKVRPDHTIKSQVEEYSENVETYAKVVSSLKSVPFPDFVCGVYSTFLYDVGLLGVPILHMETSMDYGEGMVSNSLATRMTLLDVCEIIKKEGISSKSRLSSTVSYEKTIQRYLENVGVL